MRKISYFFIITLLILSQLSLDAQNKKELKGWAKVPQILKEIVPPTFSQKEFDITKFGAVADGTTDCTAAFKDAIVACNKAGGGIVLVPKGTFLTGAIHLLSNVNLHVTKDAVIKFSPDTKKYLPLVLTRFEGVECMNYSPFIYAYEQENIAITGEGVIDGQGSNWWSWKGNKNFGWKKGEPNQLDARKKLFAMAEKGVPVKERVFGEGSYLRSNFIQPYKCKNVLIEGVTLKDSPMWVMNPVLCQNVSVLNVKVDGLGPNTDGCDPESCKNVLIKGCEFNTGDDCIAIKSGRNADGRRINVPSENIIVQDCDMKDGHGGVVIGSEISGSCYNVYAENCKMDSPHLDRGLRLKTNSVRGGVIENVYMRNVTIGQVGEAVVLVDLYYEEGDSGPNTPTIKNIQVENVTCNKTKYAVFMKGYERAPINGFKLVDCKFNNVAKPDVIENVKNVVWKNVEINGKPVEYKGK